MRRCRIGLSSRIVLSRSRYDVWVRLTQLTDECAIYQKKSKMITAHILTDGEIAAFHDEQEQVRCVLVDHCDIGAIYQKQNLLR